MSDRSWNPGRRTFITIECDFTVISGEKRRVFGEEACGGIGWDISQ